MKTTKSGSMCLILTCTLMLWTVPGCKSNNSEDLIHPLETKAELPVQDGTAVMMSGSYARLADDIPRAIDQAEAAMLRLDLPEPASSANRAWRRHRKQQAINSTQANATFDTTLNLSKSKDDDFVVRAWVLLPNGTEGQLFVWPIEDDEKHQTLAAVYKVGLFGHPYREARLLNILAAVLDGEPAPMRDKTFELPDVVHE